MSKDSKPQEHWEHPSRRPLVRDLISSAIGWAICHVSDKNEMDASERNLLDAVTALDKSVP